MPAEAFPLGIASEPTLRNRRRTRPGRWLWLVLLGASAHAQTCQSAADMGATVRTALETAVKENQTAFTGAKATVRPPFLLTADGPEPLARAEFLCGVFGRSGQTKDSAVFVLNNLPPGKYGVTILDVNGGQDPRTLAFVLQQTGADW